MVTPEMRSVRRIVLQTKLIHSTEMIYSRLSGSIILKGFVKVKSDNELCNPTAHPEACLIHILNVKLGDAFFHHYKLNPAKIYTNIVDAMTFLLVSGQKLLLANMVLRISLKK